ncbi:DUF6252 family protein [Flavobacterium piscis]|uniref:Major membrane immunogen (Membrane-anchored lipoprotein) n=1 Tax=Flavobacterium piscis TaxID=1114874 RepID=A0ABU1YF00_9FLAO|nr:DUF6252 family protein [Flavobacterium piscis]MDR7212215.1 major membrane immunogen (membrane-anchored lipoprotein) [Flavobacterium piscis]
MKKYLSIGLVILSILFTACNNDDDDKNSNKNNSVSATINDKDWKSTKINSVTFTWTAGSGQRFEINIQDDSQMLMLACESELITSDAMPLREYNFYEDPTGDEVSDALFINTYLLPGGSSLTEHMPKSGKIIITAMDANKKTVSGTFSFKSEKEANNSKIKEGTPNVFDVTNGVFKNLQYKVIKVIE